MSAGVVGVCDEGAVRFVLSYRNTATYRVAGRRFEVSFVHRDNGYHYTAKDVADAVALQAYKVAEQNDLDAWCEARSFLKICHPSTVTVDRAAWHRGVYGCEELLFA